MTGLNERGRGRKHFREAESLTHAALAVLEKHKVADCFRVTIHEEVTERRIRACGDRAEEVRLEREVQLSFVRAPVAIQELTRRFGQRVYGTN